jgi:hypothetical protein
MKVRPLLLGRTALLWSSFQLLAGGGNNVVAERKSYVGLEAAAEGDINVTAV